MDANTRTGKRREGGSKGGNKVVGAGGRYILNGNGERLLTLAGGQSLALLCAFFRTPKRGVSYPFQSPNASKAHYCLNYCITQRKDRTVGSSAMSPSAGHQCYNRNRSRTSYQVPVYVKIRLRGRFTTNHSKLDSTQKYGVMDLQKLMAHPKLRDEVLWVTLDKLGPFNKDGNATDMATNLPIYYCLLR